MGLHSGEGVLGGDNYIGLDVHRASRIASAAHGGQILVSEATSALVAHDLPEGTRLRDLGEHRLKDLAREEHLYQLSIEGLRDEFPAPNTMDAAQSNLPEYLTSFLGREKELKDVREVLAMNRLVTLTGIGGSGKTRLAAEAGREAKPLHPDGVFFVALEDATDAISVNKALAGEMSVTEQVGRPIEATLLDYLKAKNALVILDNCEQVVDPVAALVETMLRGCPQIKVLVTSREALMIPGERLVKLGPMDLAHIDGDDIDVALSADAVRLFVTRAKEAAPEFDPERWITECVEICRRLEGIPLAIELAAARSAVLSPADILARLDNRFGLLASRSRSVERRHETLEAAID